MLIVINVDAAGWRGTRPLTICRDDLRSRRSAPLHRSERASVDPFQVTAGKRETPPRGTDGRRIILRWEQGRGQWVGYPLSDLRDRNESTAVVANWTRVVNLG